MYTRKGLIPCAAPNGTVVSSRDTKIMRITRISVPLALLLAKTVSSAWAEPLPADCSMLSALVQDFTGYEVAARPAIAMDGWCVLEGARLAALSDAQPDLQAETLRLRGQIVDGAPTWIEVQLTGLRLVQGLGAKQLDERLKAIFRLQSADFRLGMGLNTEAERLEIRDLFLSLSGGTVIRIDADLAGAGMTPLGLAVGRLTMLEIEWKNDGRLLRGGMEAVGSGPDETRTADEAVRAAREEPQLLIGALPATFLEDESRRALSGMAASLPEARGVLQLSFASEQGIGAADLLLAGMADEPLGEASLGKLFASSRLEADWSPGIQP